MIFTRDDARQRITISAVGPVSLQEALSVVHQQHENGTWRYAVLYDLRAVVVPSRAAGSASHVRLLADRVGAIDPSLRGPVAVVATDVDLYVRACTYATLIRGLGRRFQVFHDLSEADVWLTTETESGQATSE